MKRTPVRDKLLYLFLWFVLLLTSRNVFIISVAIGRGKNEYYLLAVNMITIFSQLYILRQIREERQ